MRRSRAPRSLIIGADQRRRVWEGSDIKLTDNQDPLAVGDLDEAIGAEALQPNGHGEAPERATEVCGSRRPDDASRASDGSTCQTGKEVQSPCLRTGKG